VIILILGIVNIPARILYGIISDRKIISAVNLNTFAVTVATVPLFLYPHVLSLTYVGAVIFVVLFAIGIGELQKNSFTVFLQSEF
jgi:hypothetical protein